MYPSVRSYSPQTHQQGPVMLYPESDFKRLCHLGACLNGIFKDIRPHILPQTTTWQLNKIIENLVKDYGCEMGMKKYQGYGHGSCISTGNIMANGLPSHHMVLKKGQWVNVDIALYDGQVYLEGSTMFCVGKMDEKLDFLSQLAQDMTRHAVQAVKVGGRLCDIARACQKVKGSHGVTIDPWMCGHGIGAQLHQSPTISHVSLCQEDFFFQPGMVLTIEPLIYPDYYRPHLLDDGWSYGTKKACQSACFEVTLGITPQGIIVFADEQMGRKSLI